MYGYKTLSRFVFALSAMLWPFLTYSAPTAHKNKMMCMFCHQNTTQNQTSKKELQFILQDLLKK